MKIQIRARYEQKPKVGLIKVSKIQGSIPSEYSLLLFNESTNTIVQTTKKLFPSIQMAIGHASLYGFSSSFWAIEEKEF
jgi:hypothetical protein